MNPLFVFDEVDKLDASNSRAQEIISFLIHLTDKSGNNAISDRYLQSAPLDLSRASFIFTMNSAAHVSPILMDRLVRITMDTPTRDEKYEIATRFLIPRELKAAGLDGQVAFEPAAVRNIVHTHSSHEAGVRACCARCAV